MCRDCGCGDCFRIDVGDSLPIGLHSCAERNDVGGESTEIVTASEEFHDASHIRKNRLELSQRFGRSGGCSNSLCIDSGYGITIRLHGCSKGDQPLREFAKVISTGEKLHDPANIGEGRLELGKCLSRYGRCSNGFSINTRHRLAIGLHRLTEGNNTFCECRKIITSGEEINKPAHVWQRGLKLSECLSRSSRCSYRFRIDAGDGIGVGLHSLAERNDLLTKGFEIVIPCKEAYKPTRIRNGICKLHEDCSCCSGIGNSLGIQTRNSLRILLHGFTKDNNLFAKGCKVIVSCEERNRSTSIGNGVCKFYKSLTGCCRVHNGVCVKTGHSIGIFLNSLAEWDKLIAKGVHIVVSGEEGHCTSSIGQGSSHFGHCLTGNRGILNSVGVQSLDAVSKVHHRLAKARELIPKLFHVVFTNKESDYSSGIG